MEKVMVTGAQGFVGQYMAEFLKEKGLEVLEGGKENCDITDRAKVGQAVQDFKPDAIIHLAAVASIKEGFARPEKTFKVNFFGSQNILEAVKEHCPEARVVLVGSSEQYGFVREEELPIKEGQEFRPMSPYAISKVAADLLGFQYYKNDGLKIVRIRPFNHTGPRRKETFVLSSWCKQVAEMEKGLKEKVLPVGNIETVRDFTDVRDMVRGYYLAAEKAEAGEAYNLCSGKGLPLEKLVGLVQDAAKVDFEVRKSPELMRRVDVPRLVGDKSKFSQATGWQPEIPLEKTVKDMLDYWRERVGQE